MSIVRTGVITLGVAGLLTAGVFGNSYRNHYQAAVDEGYNPQPVAVPGGYESYLGKDAKDIQLLKLGHTAGLTFYQYTTDDQVYFFRIKDGASPKENMATGGLAYMERSDVTEQGFTFREEVGDQTVFAWFPAEYGKDSKGSKPFLVSYATDSDEFNEVTNPFVEPLVYSPFHHFRYQVTSANGTVNNFWFPKAKPVELTL